MTKLEKLYAGIKSLQDLGLPLNQETLKAADDLEEQLIKEEILPAMSQDIEPILSKIQRELVLVVEYKPGTPISVALSRKTNISEIIDAKKLEIDPEVTHREGGHRKQNTGQKAANTELIIHIKNGGVIQGKNAATTFTEAVIQAGILKVRQLGLKFCGINIVSTTKDKKYGRAQREVQPGLYVLTHSSTKDKKKMLDRVSAALNLGWKVEII